MEASRKGHLRRCDHRGLAACHLRQPVEHPNHAQVQQPDMHAPILRTELKTPAHSVCDGFGTIQAWALFGFWPFSRLAHVFSAPLG